MQRTTGSKRPGEAEFTALYQRYITMVRLRAKAILKDASLAEDVAQEAFMRYIDYAERNAVEYPGALLYRIATQTAYRRFKGTHKTVEMQEQLHAAMGPAVSIDDRLTLAEVIAKCDEEEAQLAVMYYVDGMNQGEIAEVYDIPRRTVSYRLERFCERANQILHVSRARASGSLTTPAALDEANKSNEPVAIQWVKP